MVDTMTSVPPGGAFPAGRVPAGVGSETTGGVQPAMPAPPQGGQWKARATEVRSEYVAGGGWSFLNTYIRSLPQWIDDTTRDFGDDLYEQMLLDPKVNSGVRILKLSVLANGVRIDPAVHGDPVVEPFETEELEVVRQARDDQGRFRPKQDEEQERRDAKLAAEIADFCHRNLQNLEGRSFIETLYEMLDGVALGNRVAEKVYEPAEEENEEIRLRLKYLKVKPRKTYSFVVDPYLNVIGLMALMPGTAYPVMAGSIIADPASAPNILAREKFAVFTWAGPSGDPRGSSLLRSIYNPWWLKRQIWGEYARYLSQYAVPSMIGYTAANAQPMPPTDAMGNIIPGMPLITPEQAMLNSLLSLRGGTAAVFSYGSKVDPLSVGGEGAAFRDAIELFDKQIANGILCQTLATEEGLHQDRASSAIHQDVLDMVVMHVKAVLASMIRRDILYDLVKLNWGEKIARRYTPTVHLAEIERHNWAQDAAAVASLVSCQFLQPDQYPEMDARLGLPRRKSQAQPPAGGAPPGGGNPFGGGGNPFGGGKPAGFSRRWLPGTRTGPSVAAFSISGPRSGGPQLISGWRS